MILLQLCSLMPNLTPLHLQVQESDKAFHIAPYAVRPGTHYPHVTWDHVMLRVQLGCERRFNTEFYDANSDIIEILKQFQNKVRRSTVNAPRYVQNTLLHTDLRIPTVIAEITNFSIKYREKLTTHPNQLTPALLEQEEPRRIKRFKPTELTTRFS